MLFNNPRFADIDEKIYKAFGNKVHDYMPADRIKKNVWQTIINKANWKPLYEKREVIWVIKNIGWQQWELQITMDRIQYYTFDLVEVVDEVFPEFVIKKTDGNGWIDDVVHHLINTARIPYPIEELI